MKTERGLRRGMGRGGDKKRERDGRDEEREG